MIFAMAVFSAVCAAMILVGLRTPKKSSHEQLRKQPAR